MTPTDRELLERAAKVVGLKKDDSPYNGGGHGNTGYALNGDMVLDWHEGRCWNPLTNNADAFALMVKLRMSVETYDATKDHSYAFACWERGEELFKASEPIGDDPEAATRRAITRAAGATVTEKGE